MRYRLRAVVETAIEADSVTSAAAALRQCLPSSSVIHELEEVSGAPPRPREERVDGEIDDLLGRCLVLSCGTCRHRWDMPRARLSSAGTCCPRCGGIEVREQER